MYGYGGVQLLDAAHRPLPTHQDRIRSAAPHLVLLRPGASASSLLHWSPLPDSTEFYVDWERDARHVVSVLRLLAGRDPADALDLLRSWLATTSTTPTAMSPTIDRTGRTS